METTNNNQIAKIEGVTKNELISYMDVMGLSATLTEQEKINFLNISQAFGLNPFKREIYCSKYGNQTSIIVGYETYIKRAERSGQLDGWNVVTEGKVEDKSLKAIITIYRKDRKYPFVHEVYYSEYVQVTRDNVVTKFWQKSFTMIKKVAMAQGFRLCFSDELGGIPYTKEEMPEVETLDIQHEVVTVIPEMFKTLDEKFKDAELMLNDVDNEAEMISIFRSLSPELQKDKRIIDLCAEIKLHYNPIANA
jgi:phage recombination protein Bet